MAAMKMTRETFHFCIFVVFVFFWFLPQIVIFSDEVEGAEAAGGGGGAAGGAAEPLLPPGSVKAHETIWKREPVAVDPNAG